MGAGEPVRDSGNLFGAGVQLARRICDAAEPATISDLYGLMFWFRWNKLLGSYFFLIDTSRL